MPLRTLALLLLFGLLAAFAVINWTAFTTPTMLSVGFAAVEAPLGLVMLGLTVVLTLLFLVFVVVQQTSVLIEIRRLSREVQVQRERADQEETSRYTELRAFLEAELAQAAAHSEESRSGTLVRLAELERDLRSAVEDAGNTLAAYIGELEGRLGGESGAGEPK